MKQALFVLVLASLVFFGGIKAWAEQAVVARKTFGCINQGFMETILHYEAQNEEVAFMRALRVGLNSGICTLFERGEKIILLDHDPKTKMVKVKKPNDPQEYWIISQMIQK